MCCIPSRRMKSSSSPTLTTSIPELIRKNGWSLLERAYASGIDINAVYHNGNTALHLAISNQLIDIKVVQFLIQKGININIQNEKGFTALHVVLEKFERDSITKLSILKILLENGANVTLQDKNSATPIHLLLKNTRIIGREDIVLLLLQYNRQIVDLINEDGLTPLHMACELGQSKIVSLLLNYGANPNIQDRKSSNTPLHTLLLKSPCDREGILKIILQKNPDLTLVNTAGMTPLQLASSLRLTNAFHLLEEAFLLSEHQNNYCSTSPAEDQRTTTLPHHLNQIPCQFAHVDVDTCSDDADDNQSQVSTTMNLAIGNDDKTVAVPTEDERKNYLEDISSGRESFESLSSHIVILTKKIEEKDNYIEWLQSSFSIAEKRLKEAEEQILSFSKQQEEANDFKEKSIKFLLENKCLKRDIDSLTKELSIMNEKNMEYKKQLEVSEDQNRQLHEILKETIQQRDNLMTTHDRDLIQIESLIETLKITEQQVESIQNSLKKYQRKDGLGLTYPHVRFIGLDAPSDDNPMEIMKGIFRFEQDDTDHDCCVKVVYKNDIKNLQNLQKEKKILKYLRRRDSSKPESHEYIVNCLCRSEEGEYFTPDNNMYFLTSHGDYTTIPISSPLLSIESILILEYGRCTLSELIISNDRLLLLTQRVHILQEIVQSIQFIHKMGVVHFDIKPENIMCFVYHGKIRWKLIDFNGSFILDENPQITREDMTLTSTSSSSTSTSLSLRYTKKYTAPEILEFLTNNSCVESIPIDESMDIWSLGILSFYLLTGNHFKESYSTLLTATTSTTATIPSDSNYFSSGDHSLDLYQDLIDQTIQYLPKKESSFLQSCLQINSKKRFNASQLLSKSLFKTNDSSQQGPSPGDLSYFLEKLGDMHDRLTCASTEKLVGILTEEFTQKFKDLYFALAVHSYRDE